MTDFRALLETLSENGVEFILVGGAAATGMVPVVSPSTWMSFIGGHRKTFSA